MKNCAKTNFINDTIDIFSKISIRCEYLDFMADGTEPELIDLSSELDSAVDYLASVRENGLNDEVLSASVALLKRSLSILDSERAPFLRLRTLQLIADLRAEKAALRV